MSVTPLEVTKCSSEADRSYLQLKQSLQLLQKGRRIQNSYGMNSVRSCWRWVPCSGGNSQWLPCRSLGKSSPKSRSEQNLCLGEQKSGGRGSPGLPGEKGRGLKTRLATRTWS